MLHKEFGEIRAASPPLERHWVSRAWTWRCHLSFLINFFAASLAGNAFGLFCGGGADGDDDFLMSRYARYSLVQPVRLLLSFIQKLKVFSGGLGKHSLAKDPRASSSLSCTASR